MISRAHCGPDPDTIPAKRLELLFACAHPIDPAVRTPFVLQVALGFDATRIACVFGVPPAAMAQRLVPGTAPNPRCRHPVPRADARGDARAAARRAGSIDGAYAIGWLDRHEHARESIADEAR